MTAETPRERLRNGAWHWPALSRSSPVAAMLVTGLSMTLIGVPSGYAMTGALVPWLPCLLRLGQDIGPGGGSAYPWPAGCAITGDPPILCSLSIVVLSPLFSLR